MNSIIYYGFIWYESGPDVYLNEFNHLLCFNHYWKEEHLTAFVEVSREKEPRTVKVYFHFCSTSRAEVVVHNNYTMSIQTMKRKQRKLWSNISLIGGKWSSDTYLRRTRRYCYCSSITLLFQVLFLLWG